MIDARLRRLIDPALNLAATGLVKAGLSANSITISGFLIGMTAVPLISFHHYELALVVILGNRLMDGLDGAVAKQIGITDVGAYLDIVLDFIFYSAIVFGFAIANPDQAVYAAFLIFSFIGTGSSFLAFAIFAAKHNLSTEFRGAKSIYYLGGLTEGTETILLFVLLCLFPAWFAILATIFGIMCWITTSTRIYYAWNQLRRSNGS
ncbi:MAG: CDP-alcohol phosphatidyltransferase family protein [Gammaproteobacteria bacterium]|nr:CDP-alcohol phosphatidyltransferase family protein [Gammaproteobacteria bacterium]